MLNCCFLGGLGSLGQGKSITVAEGFLSKWAAAGDKVWRDGDMGVTSNNTVSISDSNLEGATQEFTGAQMQKFHEINNFVQGFMVDGFENKKYLSKAIGGDPAFKNVADRIQSLCLLATDPAHSAGMRFQAGLELANMLHDLKSTADVAKSAANASAAIQKATPDQAAIIQAAQNAIATGIAKTKSIGQAVAEGLNAAASAPGAALISAKDGLSRWNSQRQAQARKDNTAFAQAHRAQSKPAPSATAKPGVPSVQLPKPIDTGQSMRPAPRPLPSPSGVVGQQGPTGGQGLPGPSNFPATPPVMPPLGVHLSPPPHIQLPSPQLPQANYGINYPAPMNYIQNSSGNLIPAPPSMTPFTSSPQINPYHPPATEGSTYDPNTGAFASGSGSTQPNSTWIPAPGSLPGTAIGYTWPPPITTPPTPPADASAGGAIQNWVDSGGSVDTYSSGNVSPIDAYGAGVMGLRGLGDGEPRQRIELPVFRRGHRQQMQRMGVNRRRKPIRAVPAGFFGSPQECDAMPGCSAMAQTPYQAAYGLWKCACGGSTSGSYFDVPNIWSSKE